MKEALIQQHPASAEQSFVLAASIPYIQSGPKLIIFLPLIIITLIILLRFDVLFVCFRCLMDDKKEQSRAAINVWPVAGASGQVHTLSNWRFEGALECDCLCAKFGSL